LPYFSPYRIVRNAQSLRHFALRLNCGQKVLHRLYPTPRWPHIFAAALDWHSYIGFILALHLVCVEIGAGGIRLVCLLLHFTRLDRFVAASCGLNKMKSLWPTPVYTAW
jgi:hypothetical protein